MSLTLLCAFSTEAQARTGRSSIGGRRGRVRGSSLPSALQALSVAVFLLVLAYRTINIIRMPVHLRWELAPIPHEKGRGHYGGSYLEEYEWWRQPRRKSRLAPLKYIAVEILLLRAVWKNNRSLWPLTFAFHGGIYLIALTALLSLAGGLVSIGGGAPNALLSVSPPGTLRGLSAAVTVLTGVVRW